MKGAIRKGFVYSIFAIVAMGLILAITFKPFHLERSAESGQKLRIDEVFYFLQSITDDLGRATTIVGRRALTSLSNWIVNNGTYLEDAEDRFEEAFVNGTVDGDNASLMNRSTIEDWTESMQKEASASGYDLNLSLFSMDLGVKSHLQVSVNNTYKLNLSDPVSSSQFDRYEEVDETISVKGMEDPLILVESAGRYVSTYSSCSYSDPTPVESTGSDSFYNNTKDWVSGTSVVRPGNGSVSSVSDKPDKVAVVADLCNYSESEIENDFTLFAGVVSEFDDVIDGKDGSRTVDVCGYDNIEMEALIEGATDSTSTDDSTMTVMTDNTFFQNELKNWTESGCYFSDPWAPSIWGRFEGRFSREEQYSDGPAAILDIPELPKQIREVNTSAVGYVYFDDNSDYGADQKIKGVTNEGINWFRLDQDHVDHWGISELTYN
ncbi:MAG: hypothetical protein SVV03_05510 [Candidatus Nanohaloarchaea archaeon]|nr:hypothetical protein [Candidatus Nanohaloarchaea archaeon]